MFVCGARINNANFQPTRQKTSALRVCDNSQRTDKATNVQNRIGNNTIMHRVHATLVEFFCSNKILVGQNKIIVVCFQSRVGGGLKLTNNTARLLKMQSVEARQGSLVLLHDAFVIGVLGAKQNAILVHLYFTTTREEQKTRSVSQRVGKRREEVAFRW